jgi:DNA polymerase III epsilon subunit-like protein
MPGREPGYVPAAKALEAVRAGVEFCALDFETTGLEAWRERIVEYGAIRFRVERPASLQGELFESAGPRRYAARVIKEGGCLLDPKHPMSPGAAKVNGISPEMLAGKPSPESMLPDIMALLSGCLVVAHNASFDLSFLKMELARAGREMPTMPFVDTRDLAREAFPGKQSYKLQDLARELGLKAENAHRAVDDARLCMELFARCVEALAR